MPALSLTIVLFDICNLRHSREAFPPCGAFGIHCTDGQGWEDVDRTDRAGHCYKVEIKKHFRMGNAAEGRTQQLKVKIGSAEANLLNALVQKPVYEESD